MRVVRRWGLPLLLAALCCIPIFLQRSSSAALLKDTDTAVLLAAIRDRHAPLSWFVSDWPLKNHFYRPLPSLAFELDNALYGHNAAGFGLTNALLCCLCVLLQFWFASEVFRSPWKGSIASAAFALWHTPYAGIVGDGFLMLAVALLVAAQLRRWVVGEINRRSLAEALLGALLIGYLAIEANGMVALGPRLIGWLPGRTASIMTLFCLGSLASFTRYLNLKGSRDELPVFSPLTVPSTKGTTIQTPEPVRARIFYGLSVAAALLALASYEQGVMLPLCLAILPLMTKRQGTSRAMLLTIPHFGVLALMLMVRTRFVPFQVSGYQMQQFRHGPGVWLDLMTYVFPAYASLQSLLISLASGWSALLFGSLYSGFAAVASNVATLLNAWSSRPALIGYWLSLVAFLPMAWLKMFEHYHYWPMALRSLFFSACLIFAFRRGFIAISPPVRQAPPRQNPSPGSLPRR